MKKEFFFAALLLFTLARHSYAEGYPLITELSSQNPVFIQYQQDVEEANKALASKKEPVLSFYTYRACKTDSLFSIAARCSIPYETIATLNSISDTQENISAKTLILPSIAGVFIPYKPLTAVEILLAKEHSVKAMNGEFPSYTINGKKYYFIKGARLNPTERAFFLNSGMHLPLENSVLSSSFGMRVSPISGRWIMHHGIDMAAPEGSSIFACKSGTVIAAVTMDNVYGNYVVIKHSEGMTSLYAHMSSMSVKKGDIVQGGDTIGKVGLTGLTTGPHLHFEIQQNGEYKDPEKYLP